MTVAPQDIAAGRFKLIRQAQQGLAKAEAIFAKSVARREELRREIGPAERRDREALGQAIVDGKPEPAGESEKLEAELEREERRADALALAVETARRRISGLVTANKTSWRREAIRDLSRAHRRYQDAIGELEAARDAFSDEPSLVAWLDSGASATAVAASDPLGSRAGSSAHGHAPTSFARTLEELRADAEAIAAYPLEP